MRTFDFPFQVVDKLTFEPKPQPLPATLRPVYRIAQLVLVLRINCRGRSASFLKLQFFNWLLKSPSLQVSVENKLTSEGIFSLELIHLDPMVNLALKYAFADSLITITKNSKYKLTEKGCKFAELVLQDNQFVFVEEKKYLKQIGVKVSEVKLRKEQL